MLLLKNQKLALTSCFDRMINFVFEIIPLLNEEEILNFMEIIKAQLTFH